MKRFLWAGEPLYNAEAGAPAGAQGGGPSNPPPDDGLFDKGYGKGVQKGKSEATAALLAELGLPSVDSLKAAVKSAADAEESARKAAEQQGQFKQLYEAEKARADSLLPFKARVEQIETDQKAQLATIVEKLTDADKVIIAGLPVDKALALAQRLTATPGKPPVGGPPAGNGGEPGSPAAKTLEWYEKKGYQNLTPVERAEAEALFHAQNKTTVGDLQAAAMKAAASS